MALYGKACVDMIVQFEDIGLTLCQGMSANATNASSCLARTEVSGSICDDGGNRKYKDW